MKRYDDDLLFVAHPTPTVKLTVTSLERTVTLIRARLAGIGVRNAGIVRDETKIRISLPDGLAKPAARRVVGAPGRLAFYDWEKSVLGPDGSCIRSTSRSRAASRPASPATARRATTWRSSAPRGSGHRQAHQRVGLRRRRSREVRPRGPQATKADARESCRNAGKKPTSFVRRATSSRRPRPTTPTRRRRPPLRTRTTSTTPRPCSAATSRTPSRSSTARSASPTSRSTSPTRAARSGRASRGSSLSAEPTGCCRALPRGTVANHFAIVLDTKLILVLYVDPQRNPDGIDATNGSQIWGVFTTKSAQRLAVLIKTGVLPLSLELVENAS